MIKISAYGDLSFLFVCLFVCFVLLPFLISQHFEAILASLSLNWFDSCHLKISCWAMSKRNQVYADEYKFLVVKTVSKWKRTFHCNLQIQKRVHYFLPYLIYFVYFRAGFFFSDGPQTNRSSVFAHSYIFFDIEFMVYNLYWFLVIWAAILKIGVISEELFLALPLGWISTPNTKSEPNFILFTQL